jgi:hypothetical protein
MGLKLAAAVWTTSQLYRTRVVSDRALMIGAGSWTLMVLVLQVVSAWINAVLHLPAEQLTLLIILAVPLARVSAAPLAVAWHRHS